MADVCKEYGGGLYLLAAESKSEALYFEQLSKIKAILEENPEYLRLLSSPILSASEKKELICGAFEGRVTGYIVNFMLLMCDRGYFGHMIGCIDFFKKKYYQHMNISEGVVKSAVPLSDEEKEKITKALETKLGGKKLMLEFSTDEGLYGGLYVEIEGKVFDSTVKTKLSGLRDVLSKA